MDENNEMNEINTWAEEQQKVYKKHTKHCPEGFFAWMKEWLIGNV